MTSYGRSPGGTITVSSRTIDLAGEIIVIPQIVRLREMEFEIRRGLAGRRTALLVLGIVLLLFGLMQGSASSDPTGGILVVLGLAITLGVLLYAFQPHRRYILAIELASGSLSGLSAKNPVALQHLRGQIQQVIEHPPTQPTPLPVGDVWIVDARGSQGGQFGSNNLQFNN